MDIKKNKNITILFSVFIGVIIIAIFTLLILAFTDRGNSGLGTSPSPSAGNDEFDPNDIIVRDDPIIMTVNLSPIRFSEFNYFYYISASEVINNIDIPEDADKNKRSEIIKNVLDNGIDGKSFDEIIFEKAKDYTVKYILYRMDYVSAGFTSNEAYALYLHSNFMPAGYMEELEEYNKQLLYDYGVVRNEYINILIYNDAINNYKKHLREKADYSDAELKSFYDEKSSLFSYKSIRIILLNKEDTELAEKLKNQIDSGYDMEQLVSDYSVSPTKGTNKGVLNGNLEDFKDEKISSWFSGAKLKDTEIIPTDDGIYVVKYENDGSFEMRKDVVSDYKAIYDYDVSLDKKITNGEINVIMSDNVVAKLERPEFLTELY